MAIYKIDNRPTPIEFENGTDETQRIIRNVKNLIMTRMGEVPFDRMRGFDNALFDLPITELQTKLMPEIDRVLMWETRAKAIDARAILEPGGVTIIEITAEIE